MEPTSDPPKAGWEACTAEGAELHTLLLGLKSSIREKLIWLEQAEELSMRLKAARGSMASADVRDGDEKES